MISAKEILNQYWGYSKFRKPQEEIINAVASKNDVIALLPTGSGKSLCFQIPALQQKGICLVISPLIALMQDQVNALQQLNIKATNITSGLKQDEIITLFDNIKYGNYKFLYISPERLQSTFIQQKIKELHINLVAVDEAHCISEWGHDFRPSYRNIHILKTIISNVNFIALTATANKKVLEDIKFNLQLISPKIFKKSFFKEHLAYQIFDVENKLEKLLQIFTKTKVPTIIYVNSRKKTHEISNFLNQNNYKCTYYHGGLNTVQKNIAFTNWLKEETPIIVATSAFGMGIDKENVGLVIHYNLPNSIENYVQEAGRAGRNNKKSFAVLLKNNHDIENLYTRLEKSMPNIKEIKIIYKKLCQFFNIHLGEINEEVFSFNLLEFSKTYNFSVLKVDTAIKFLSNNGVLQVSDTYNKKSTLKIVVTSKQLISYTKQQKEFEQFIHQLLRSYGGLFEQETKINEYFLAKKCGKHSKEIIAYLEKLHQEKIAIYKPVTSESEISFLVPREDDFTINKISKEITKLINQKKKKTQDFITFLKNDSACRSIQILNYFDEYSTKNCGICDVCLAKKNNNTKNIQVEILTILANKKPKSSQEICRAIKAKEKEILKHLRWLLSTDKVALNQQNKYILKDK